MTVYLITRIGNAWPNGYYFHCNTNWEFSDLRSSTVLQVGFWRDAIFWFSLTASRQWQHHAAKLPSTLSIKWIISRTQKSYVCSVFSQPHTCPFAEFCGIWLILSAFLQLHHYNIIRTDIHSSPWRGMYAILPYS